MGDHSHLAIWLGPTISAAIFFVGGLIGYGKLKGVAVTNSNCKANQQDCQNHLVSEIKEVKELVVELHDKQTKRIEELDKKNAQAIHDMDKKRHDNNNKHQEMFLKIQLQFTDTQAEFNRILSDYQKGFSELQKQVGTIEGYIKAQQAKNGGKNK